MKITVNGKECELVERNSIQQLLEKLGFTHGSCAVAVNFDFVPRTDYATTVLKPGDDVEIVTPRQGG